VNWNHLAQGRDQCLLWTQQQEGISKSFRTESNTK
jgi:hypothetical protein